MGDIVDIKQEQTKFIERIRGRVEAQVANGISRNAIGREAGISSGAVSAFLSGTYKADMLPLAQKLDAWLTASLAREQAKLPAAPAWIETPTAQRIMTALSYAQMASDLACIYGAAGVGKTATLHHYAQATPNVWIATMTPATASAATCLEEVCEAVGLRDASGGAARMQRALINRLRDTRGLLAIDEAQHLSVSALETIRSLHDATGIGLAILGNETVYARITGGTRAANFAQLFSRIGKRLRVQRPTDKDVRELLDAWKIDGREEREISERIALAPGGLRGLTKTLRLASMLAQGKTPGAQEIRAAWRDLGGEQ